MTPTVPTRMRVVPARSKASTTNLSVQISWPPTFSFRGRSCAVLVAASVQILLSLDRALAPAIVSTDGTQDGTQNALTLAICLPIVMVGGRPRTRNAYPGRDRSPPLLGASRRELPRRSAASSAGAGSLSGPRRSRTLTTRIALPIARIHERLRGHSHRWRADRTTGRTVNGHAPYRTIGRPPSRIRGVVCQSLDAAIHQPFDSRHSDPLTRLYRKEGCPERESTYRHPRAGPGPIARCDRALRPVRDSAAVPRSSDPFDKLEQTRRYIDGNDGNRGAPQATRVIYGVNELELDLAGRRIRGIKVLEQVFNIPRDAS